MGSQTISFSIEALGEEPQTTYSGPPDNALKPHKQVTRAFTRVSRPFVVWVKAESGDQLLMLAAMTTTTPTIGSETTDLVFKQFIPDFLKKRALEEAKKHQGEVVTVPWDSLDGIPDSVPKDTARR